ncbi:MAG: hypothetical protein JW982_13790 [Spirochaetes bacterium]|nr:hypothetical protein [Spirochaetota bacterium]
MINLISKLLVFSFSVIILTTGIRAEKQPVILILGIESNEINEIQDRIIREEILRLYLQKNYKIVPIMKLTGFIEENHINLQTLNQTQIPQISHSLEADIAVFCRNSRKNELQIFVYDRNKNKFFKKSIVIDSIEPLNKITPILIDVIFRNSIQLVEEL